MSCGRLADNSDLTCSRSNSLFLFFVAPALSVLPPQSSPSLKAALFLPRRPLVLSPSTTNPAAGSPVPARPRLEPGHFSASPPLSPLSRAPTCPSGAAATASQNRFPCFHPFSSYLWYVPHTEAAGNVPKTCPSPHFRGDKSLRCPRPPPLPTSSSLSDPHTI